MANVALKPKPTPKIAIFSIPLETLVQDEPLFELALKYEATRNQIIDAVVGMADGLLGIDLTYPECGEFVQHITKRPPNNELVDCVLEIADRLVRHLPLKATELLCLHTGYGNLYIKVTLQP